MDMAIQVISAFVGSLGFGLLFRVKRDKLFWGALGGAMSWIFYLAAAEKIQTDISQCLVFEDSLSGIESARRAGAGKIIQVLSMKEIRRFDHVDACISDYTGIQELMELAELL